MMHRTRANGGATRSSICALVAFLGASLTMPMTGQASQYDFSLIASTGETYPDLGKEVSLNDDGAVAFRARLPQGSLPEGGSKVLLGYGGSNTTTIATLLAGYTELMNLEDGCSVNSQGQVAFAGLIEASPIPPVTRHLFVGDGTSIIRIASAGSTGISSVQPVASINDLGAVAYAFPFLYVGVRNIATGSTTSIAEGQLGDPAPGAIVSAVGPPAINNEGTVAFIGYPRNFLNRKGIYTGNGGPATMIAQSKPADPASPILTLGPPSINDSGLVAFAAELENEEQAIFTAVDGQLVRSIDTLGSYKSLSRKPAPTGVGTAVGYVAVNEAGELAFAAELDDGTQGIFTGPDPQSQKVIAVGDALFGSTVTSLSFFRDGLNNAGQLAFHAVLADGRQVVVRADPLPEPFKSFDAQAVVLDLPRAHVQLDVIGSIQLADASNGIEPLNEDVGISVTNQDGVTWNATLPPGSFKRAGRTSFVSRGARDELVRFMSITAERRDGRYTFTLQGVDVDDLADGNTHRVSKTRRVKRAAIPLTISLRIGDDSATKTLRCTAGGKVSVCH